MDDYIDRQAAIKDVYAIHTVDTEYDAALLDRLDVRYVLEALPSADVAPVRRGRWETDGMPMDDGEYLVTRCTACGTAYEYGHNDNYCGFCGARMDCEHERE